MLLPKDSLGLHFKVNRRLSNRHFSIDSVRHSRAFQTGETRGAFIIYWGYRSKQYRMTPSSVIYTESNAALNGIMYLQNDYYNGHGSLLILLLFEYWKFRRNILCSTRLSVVERARMSHAVNWKMPNLLVSSLSVVAAASYHASTATARCNLFRNSEIKTAWTRIAHQNMSLDWWNAYKYVQ